MFLNASAATDFITCCSCCPIFFRAAAGEAANRATGADGCQLPIRADVNAKAAHCNEMTIAEGTDPDTIAQQLAEFEGHDFEGLTEVNGDHAKQYIEAYEEVITMLYLQV
jgi:hypothetical protein